MVLFSKPKLLRRFNSPEVVDGYYSASYTDMTVPMDIQASENAIKTNPEGDKAVEKLNAFSDEEIYVDCSETGRKADMLWHNGKWYQARSSVLCENTLLKHWESTFVECLEQDEPPETEGDA